jgi:hypothetical protein
MRTRPWKRRQHHTSGSPRGLTSRLPSPAVPPPRSSSSQSTKRCAPHGSPTIERVGGGTCSGGLSGLVHKMCPVDVKLADNNTTISGLAPRLPILTSTKTSSVLPQLVAPLLVPWVLVWRSVVPTAAINSYTNVSCTGTIGSNLRSADDESTLKLCGPILDGTFGSATLDNKSYALSTTTGTAVSIAHTDSNKYTTIDSTASIYRYYRRPG